VSTDQPQNATEGERTSREFSMNLRYLGQSRIEVRGVFTGEIYRFSTAMPVLPVDLSDAKALLACNLFTIA
jgi:hypothetical protein